MVRKLLILNIYILLIFCMTLYGNFGNAFRPDVILAGAGLMSLLSVS